MKVLTIACLIAFASTELQAQTRSALRVIREDGALVLVEGGSYYRFGSDSTFDSGPIGISGRTIRGRWRGGDDLFVIEGRWGWLNGQSLIDDYRRMTMRISWIEGPGTIDTLALSGAPRAVRVHRGYYYVDDVVRIPPAAANNRDTALRSAPTVSEIRIPTNHMSAVGEVIWKLYDTSVDPRSVLEIDFGSNLAATLPAIQVWLLETDGTAIAPTRVLRPLARQS